MRLAVELVVTIVGLVILGVGSNMSRGAQDQGGSNSEHNLATLLQWGGAIVVIAVLCLKHFW